MSIASWKDLGFRRRQGKRLPWCKLYEKWWSTQSHADISGIALAVGVRCLSLANQSPVLGVLLTESGQPKSAESIARDVRFPVSDVRAALAELTAVGTLAICEEDGAYCFPNFDEYQEGSSTGRTREYRARLKASQPKASTTHELEPTAASPHEPKASTTHELEPTTDDMDDSSAPVVHEDIGVLSPKAPKVDYFPKEASKDRPPATTAHELAPSTTTHELESATTTPKASKVRRRDRWRRRADEVEQVVDAYRRAGHQEYQPDWKVRNLIAERLEEGRTVECLVQAMRGLHASPWHNGSRGGRFLELWRAVESGDAVQRFAELCPRPPQIVSTRTHQALERGSEDALARAMALLPAHLRAGVQATRDRMVA